MQALQKYIGIDFEGMKAKEFEDFIVKILEVEGMKVKRQVEVKNRGDGRRGYVDIVAYSKTESIGIEIDRKTPRVKSIFKLKQLGAGRMYCFTRSPFNIIQVF